MAKYHFFGKKCLFSELKKKIYEKIRFWTDYDTNICILWKKLFFLVKIGQKSRHGCVKSEHVLWGRADCLDVSWGQRELFCWLKNYLNKLFLDHNYWETIFITHIFLNKFLLNANYLEGQSFDHIFFLSNISKYSKEKLYLEMMV